MKQKRYLLTIHPGSDQKSQEPVNFFINRRSYILPRGAPYDVPSSVYLALRRANKRGAGFQYTIGSPP
jgi:hypothetical protein